MDEPSDVSRPHKVFGLGLARTGTTSMHRAMTMLGLRSAPESSALLDTIDEAFLARYDAFFDNPIPFRYQALAQRFPASRYIVTYRPVEGWLQSMEWLFGPGLDRLDAETRQRGDRVHRSVYGTDRFDPALLTEIHERHYREVKEFVADRPHVWLDADDGFAWKPICDLLELPIPRGRFPHANKRRRRWRR